MVFLFLIEHMDPQVKTKIQVKSLKEKKWLVTWVKNLEIIKSDLENNLIYVKGSIPGSKNSVVLLKQNVKKVNRTTTLDKIKQLQTASEKNTEKKTDSKKTEKAKPKENK